MYSKIPQLPILVLPHALGLALPVYETSGSAGFDLRAALKKEQTLRLQPRKRILVPTGLIFEVPINFEVQIRPRSGLALKYGITCLNTPGTIDSDYRGEIQVLLINFGDEDFYITRGMRIAQSIFAPVMRAEFLRIYSISETTRDQDGFGSTGY